MAAARLHGADYKFEIDELGRDAMRFRSGGLAESARFFRDGDQLYIQRQGITFSVHDLTKSAPASASASSSDGRLRAAMNGRVVAVLVKQGERVTAGQPAVTLEAMKMEHVHAAPISGTISAIHVAEGQQVTTAMIIAEIDGDQQPA